jgi:hypothetical protein
LEDDIVRLYEDYRREISSGADFVRSERVKEYLMVIARQEGAALKVLDVLSIGGSATTKNSHRVRVTFCLADSQNACVKPQ